MDRGELDEGDGPYYPVHINSLALPEDAGVKLAYAVYNPSIEALKPESEKNRQVFAEVFIADPNLGTLSDLCTRVLAREYGLESLALSDGDPKLRRLQLEAIPVDRPLEDIYEIDDWRFWKRVALALTTDIKLRLMDDSYDWKSEGITLKYVELVEECAAEYWPEIKMNALAQKVKDHVTHMYVRKLQPMQEFSFAKYAARESDTDKTDSTEVSHTSEDEMIVTSSRASSMGEEEENKSDEAKAESNSSLSVKEDDDDEESEENAKETKRIREKLQIRMEQRREDRRQRREAQEKRRKIREEKRLQRMEEENRPRPRRIKVRNIFDLPIDEPQDDEKKKRDGRNISTQLKYKKKNIFLPNRCHHIDLNFVSNFDRLVSFQIEFRPPDLKMNYHPRFFEFSLDDIKNLANGIVNLENLRIFRLRNSRMDEDKLEVLVNALKQMNIEVIDFGNDNLNDDSEIALSKLFKGTTTIKSLELEGNKFRILALASLGRALKSYEGQLEYLGLARNPITGDGLHALIGKIAPTPQIQSLCLAGVRISEMAMFCCMVNELLTVHTVLRSLDISGSPISSKNENDLAKALSNNMNITHLDCRECSLSEDIEEEIEIYLARNRYVAGNPFIGDLTTTEAEVKEFVNRIKNPVLLAANERFEKRKACMSERPDIAKRTSSTLASSMNESEFGVDLERSHAESFAHAFSKSESIKSFRSFATRVDEDLMSLTPFVYNVMDFDEKQFHEHVLVPGPANRYDYMQAKKQKLNENAD